MSETIGALMGALAVAQATIGGANKGKVNPLFKSNYADLASVWNAWQAVGPPNDLAVAQWNGGVVEGRVEITTMLAHKSGEWMRETALIPLGKVDAQGYVSAVTYGRRCALSALAGIAPADDDGNAAVRAPRGAAMQAFCIPTGGDNDADATSHELDPRAVAKPDPDFSPGRTTVAVTALLKAAKNKAGLDMAWRDCRHHREAIKAAEPGLHTNLLAVFKAKAETFKQVEPDALDDDVNY